MVTAVKLRNALLTEAEKRKITIQTNIHNIRVNGMSRGCSGHVTDKGSGGCVYLSAEERCYAPLCGKAMYRYAANERDYSSNGLANGFNQWCDENELAACVVRYLLSGKGKHNIT